MDILSTVEPIIQKYKPQLIAAAGSQEAVTSDEGLAKIAAELHGLLPFAVRTTRLAHFYPAIWHILSPPLTAYGSVAGICGFKAVSKSPSNEAVISK